MAVSDKFEQGLALYSGKMRFQAKYEDYEMFACPHCDAAFSRDYFWPHVTSIHPAELAAAIESLADMPSDRPEEWTVEQQRAAHQMMFSKDSADE